MRGGTVQLGCATLPFEDPQLERGAPGGTSRASDRSVGRDTRFGAHDSLGPRCRCDSNRRPRYSDFQLDRVLQHQLPTRPPVGQLTQKHLLLKLLERWLGSTFVAIGV